MDIAIGDGNHFDLLIVNNDLVFDDAGHPLTIDGRPSIAQDIAHRIRESNLLLPTIAERSAMQRRHCYVQIEQLVEGDERIVPGSCEILESAAGQTQLTASTYEYQGIAFFL